MAGKYKLNWRLAERIAVIFSILIINLQIVFAADITLQNGALYLPNGMVTDGSVGIGTIDPGPYKLKVIGNTYSDTLCLSDGCKSTWESVGGGSIGGGWTDSGATVKLTTISDKVAIGDNTASTAGALTIYGNEAPGTNSLVNEGLVLGQVTGASGYSWLQSYGQKPLVLNPLSNYVGIGTITPQAKMHIVSPNTQDNNYGDLTVENAGNTWSLNQFGTYSNTPVHSSQLILRRARGTITSPAAVSNGDQIGGIFMRGYDGFSYQQRAYITSFVNGPVSTGNVPIDLIFNTGSTSPIERMRIKSDGKIGIGTPTPNAKLQIEGDVLTRVFPADDTTQGLTSYSLESRDTGGKRHVWRMYTAPVGGGWGVPPNSVTFWEYNDANGDGNFCQTGEICAPRLVLQGKTGKVGIGISNPSKSLDVAGDVKAQGFCIGDICKTSWDAIGGGTVGGGWTDDGDTIRLTTSTDKVAIGSLTPQSGVFEIYRPAGTNAKLQLFGAGDNRNFAGISLRSDEATDKIWEITHRQEAANLNKLIFFYNDGTNWYPRLTLDTAGKVGIGTASPLSKLQVQGTDVGISVVNNAANQNWYFGIKDSGTDSTKNNLYIGAGKDPSQGVSPAIVVTTGTGGQTYGNVGIGTITPGAKLDIGGNSQSSARISARYSGTPSFEFGHTNTAGYGSTIGATEPSGYPYLAFNAESETTGNTFKTRGKMGRVIWSNLGGGLVFSRATNTNAGGQTLTDDMIIDGSGNVGIGTTDTGAYKLKVAGNIYGDNLCLSDGCKSTWASVGGGGGTVDGWTKAGNNVYVTAMNDDRVSIGTPASTASKVHIVNSNNNDVDFEVEHNGNSYSTSRFSTYSDTPEHSSQLILRRARSVWTSPAAVANGDRIGSLSFSGRSTGGSIIESAAIRGIVNGAVTSTSVPIDLVFYSDLGGLPAERMRIKSNGVVSFGGGSGKIDAGTIDPIYTIGGIKYATYLPAMTGVKEETTGTILLKNKNKDDIYYYEINFNNLEEGNDLWLFSKTTNLNENFDNLVVLLTPSFNGKVWYEKDFKNKKLIIYAQYTQSDAQADLEISYRLTAPRFDSNEWSNYADSENEGFNLDKEK